MAQDDKSKLMEQVGMVFNLGVQMVTTIGVMGAIGWWIDKKAETSPLFLIIFLLTGSGAALYHFIKSVLSTSRQKN